MSAKSREGVMWTVTDEQFNFLKVRFKDPLLWLEDCDRWIGRPLTGDKSHWCYDWDGLPVDETTDEFKVCTCWNVGYTVEDHQGESTWANKSSK
jgi:hypothetical protein